MAAWAGIRVCLAGRRVALAEEGVILMTSMRTRRTLAALLAVGAIFVGACDGDTTEGDVDADPQGPAENAPGTDAPLVSPDE